MIWLIYVIRNGSIALQGLGGVIVDQFRGYYRERGEPEESNAVAVSLRVVSLVGVIPIAGSMVWRAAWGQVFPLRCIP